MGSLTYPAESCLLWYIPLDILYLTYPVFNMSCIASSCLCRPRFPMSPGVPLSVLSPSLPPPLLPVQPVRSASNRDPCLSVCLSVCAQAVCRSVEHRTRLYRAVTWRRCRQGEQRGCSSGRAAETGRGWLLRRTSDRATGAAGCDRGGAAWEPACSTRRGEDGDGDGDGDGTETRREEGTERHVSGDGFGGRTGGDVN